MCSVRLCFFTIVTEDQTKYHDWQNCKSRFGNSKEVTNLFFHANALYLKGEITTISMIIFLRCERVSLLGMRPILTGTLLFLLNIQISHAPRTFSWRITNGKILSVWGKTFSFSTQEKVTSWCIAFALRLVDFYQKKKKAVSFVCCVFEHNIALIIFSLPAPLETFYPFLIR